MNTLTSVSNQGIFYALACQKVRKKIGTVPEGDCPIFYCSNLFPVKQPNNSR